jgi:integrase
MPRKATGYPEQHGDHWDARISLADGGRPRVCLAGAKAGRSEAAARAKAAELTAVARAEGKTSADFAGEPKPEAVEAETLEQYAERWFKHREEKRMTSVRPERSYLRNHVFAKLGARPVGAITRADLEDLVEYLDKLYRKGALSWKTTANVWGTVSVLFADARGSKVRALRVRDDNPALDVTPPDRGTRKAKVYLWPSEFLALVTCEAIPLAWRVLYALAVYAYVRPGELAALDLADVDLEHGTLHVHAAVDHQYGGTKEVKTGQARYVPIEAELMPLLRALHKRRGGAGPVVEAMPDENELATTLRAHLKLAGVTRRALFTNDATRKWMTFYDLRATGITWLAVRGDAPLTIMHRAGHSDFKTTQIYVREAENLRAGFGAVFPPLPPSVVAPNESPNGGGGGAEGGEGAGDSRAPTVGLEPTPYRANPHETQGKRAMAPGGIAPDRAPNPAITRPPGESMGASPSPRAVFLAALAHHAGALALAGDLAAARVASRALAELLAEGGGGGAAVVDLAAEREKRERS